MTPLAIPNVDVDIRFYVNVNAYANVNVGSTGDDDVKINHSLPVHGPGG